jgi:hypothetical protein
MRTVPMLLLLPGPIGMGIALAVGLFDRLESVAMVPTHVWDAVPGAVQQGGRGVVLDRRGRDTCG